MSSFNCCLLTCIHISHEAGNVFWYSHLLKNFPHFFYDPHSQRHRRSQSAEVDFPVDVVNLISGSSAFSKSSLNIWRFTVHVLLRPGLEYFEQAPFRGCLILIRDKMLCHFLVAKFQGFIFFQFGVNKRHLSAAYVPHTYVPHKYVFTILYSQSLW